MASNSSSYSDSNDENDDWIELHNRSEKEIDLSGWYLSDNEDNPRKWSIPENSSIPAGGYLIIWADEDENQNTLEELHANFKLSSSGEFLSLTSPDKEGNLIMDQIIFGNQEQNISFGRKLPDIDKFEKMTPTPGSANQ